MAARQRAEPASPSLPRPFTEFLGVVLLGIAVLVLGGLASLQAGSGSLMGPVGQLAAGALYAGFGMAAYLVGLGVLGLGIKALAGDRMEVRPGEALGFAAATLSACVLMHVTFPGYRIHGFTSGGLVGEMLGEVGLGMFDVLGTYVVALMALCLGLFASTPFSARHLLVAGRWSVRGADALARRAFVACVEFLRDQRDAWREARETYDRERHGEIETPRADASGSNRKRSAKPIKHMLAVAPMTTAEAGDDAADEEETDELEAEDDEEVDESEDDEEEEEGGAVASKKSPKPRKRPDDELPEIVVSEPAEPDRAKHGKKAPPRPEQLQAGQLAIAKAEDGPARRKEAATALPGVIRLTDGAFQLPPLELLEVADKLVVPVDRGFVLEQAERLVNALAEFKIKGKVTKIHPGPVITRYEFKPEAGVKLSRIESLENDIAMALEALRIRILAPIPGKSTVGFEVPNKSRETVCLKEILSDDSFLDGSRARLPLGLGKDITGKPRSVDLSKAPHLLVAGATGSGKSVGVNAMICSLLYSCSPEDVRMVMIDPKMLELSIYEGIPHLLLPVVTDPEKANLALRWAVQEMERRYEMLSEAQVRDIAGYNKKLPELIRQWEGDVKAAKMIAAEAEAAVRDEGEDAVGGVDLAGVQVGGNGELRPCGGAADLPDKPVKLPYVVVIIDEFADLMMVASKEVEQNVARIAAKARASGIHLIVATQRPSVDVITGTIKNNFPTRIAFQVTSDADSRTILDTKGAKQLLGMGDMLYMERGGEPQRVHGCFVSEDEILKVVDFVKKQAKPVYNMDIVRKQDDDGDPEERDESFDPLYDKAVQIVAETQKVSTSMLQRRLNVGYNRAAKIVEKMEEEGVIGPSRGTTPREVHVRAA